MNWSPASFSAVGADHVAPRSNDWLTITSEFVLAVYGSLGAGVALSRMSDQTTARWAALAGSAAMALPSPQAATYSLARRSPTLVSTPLPAATRATLQVLPPSPELETRMSGFWALTGPTKRKPRVA